MGNVTISMGIISSSQTVSHCHEGNGKVLENHLSMGGGNYRQLQLLESMNRMNREYIEKQEDLCWNGKSLENLETCV